MGCSIYRPPLLYWYISKQTPLYLEVILLVHLLVEGERGLVRDPEDLLQHVLLPAGTVPEHLLQHVLLPQLPAHPVHPEGLLVG